MLKNKRLVEGAILIAMSVILTRFFSIKLSVGGVDGVRIGIGVLPIMIAGLRYGAGLGAKVGALADIIGYMLIPGGAYMPHFTLTSALNGVLPPLLAGNSEKCSGLRLFCALTITHLVLSMIMVPYFLNVLFGIPYRVMFFPRLISFFINVFIINFVVILLQRRINILRVMNQA